MQRCTPPTGVSMTPKASVALPHPAQTRRPKPPLPTLCKSTHTPKINGSTRLTDTQMHPNTGSPAQRTQQGHPPDTQCGGMSVTTTEPAPTLEQWPTTMGPSTLTPAPSSTPLPGGGEGGRERAGLIHSVGGVGEGRGRGPEGESGVVQRGLWGLRESAGEQGRSAGLRGRSVQALNGTGLRSRASRSISLS